MNKEFSHYNLELIQPAFDSKLTDLIIELDYLRRLRLGGTTPTGIFFQIKNIFHMLESLGSSRIEGNRTTLAELIETKIDTTKSKDERIIEIQNMENTLNYIDNNINTLSINRSCISDLHKQILEGLTTEGSNNPGEYRKENIRIAQSKHIPPDYTQVGSYMDEIITFINAKDPPKYDLLKTAITHHRFAWIHPFDNGNGRSVRLLTYAMLVKQGFNINVGKIINPTAVFCMNRQKYYDKLAEADKGTYEGIINWCEYVLEGLKNEIEKIFKLVDYGFLSKVILLPAIDIALERKFLKDYEGKILKIAIANKIFKASDIKNILPNKSPPEYSRILRGLKERRLIITEKENARKYIICFENNYLLRGVISMLDKKGFLTVKN